MIESISDFFTLLTFKNVKINFLKKLSVLRAVFDRVEVQVITNPSSRLEKHQTLDVLLMTVFYDFFLNLNFCIF